MVGWIDQNLWFSYLAIVVWLVSSFILFLCYKRALKTRGYITNGKYASIKDWFLIAPLIFLELFSFLFSLVITLKISGIGIILAILMGTITGLLIFLLVGWGKVRHAGILRTKRDFLE